jgi:acyl carrier protein
MDKDELFKKVQSLVAEKLEIDPSKVTPEASFRKDLGADSLDTYELVYAIEEEMGVTIPDEKANEFETVQDAIDYLSTQVK